MSDKSERIFNLADGEFLTAETAVPILRSAPTKVIVVAGPARCGKTTLVGGLYELYHKGPFGGLRFAGSRTLPGFEQRCHLARIASGRETPDTERTLHSDEQEMLHLHLQDMATQQPEHLLFTDIYGEAFRTAADNVEACKRFSVLKRADHVTVLIDGAAAVDKGRRQSAFLAIDDLLSQCLDCGMLGNQSSVQAVVTKWDLVAAAQLRERSFVNEKLEWLTARHQGRLPSLVVHKVAVRPDVNGGAVGVGYGIAELLDRWRSIRIPPLGAAAIVHADVCSEFDRSQQSLVIGGAKS